MGSQQLFATPTLGSDNPPGSWWWKKVARGENGGGGDGWEDRVTPVRVFNTITSQYETLQTYDDNYRLLTETRLHEGAQSGSGDECEAWRFRSRRRKILKAQRMCVFIL